MARYIDADAYIKYCEDNCVPLNEYAVKSQPTVNVVSIVHAKWKDECCTNCGTPKFAMKVVRGFDEVIYEYEGEANYCPNCGAKMEE